MDKKIKEFEKLLNIILEKFLYWKSLTHKSFDNIIIMRN